MKARAFDGISREFGVVSTRLGFLRLLGGATALGAVTAVGLGESASAKRKKKKKCKPTCNSEERCVKGKCVPIDRPQPAICTSWIISGGPESTAAISVDDDLRITLNGTPILNDGNKMAGTLPPVSFPAKVGDSLAVTAHDAVPSCRSLSPLWLHCATTGQKRQLFAGNNDGCAPGRTAGDFVNQVYTISL
jgi:hypothetical protein